MHSRSFTRESVPTYMILVPGFLDILATLAHFNHLVNVS